MALLVNSSSTVSNLSVMWGYLKPLGEVRPARKDIFAVMEAVSAEFESNR